MPDSVHWDKEPAIFRMASREIEEPESHSVIYFMVDASILSQDLCNIIIRPMQLYYKLSPDIAIVPLKEGGILFKSDTLGIKLEGESAMWLVDNVFPLLNGENDLEYVSGQFRQLALKDLQDNLDQLVQSGVLICLQQKWSLSTNMATDTGIPRFFTNFLQTTGRAEKYFLPELAKCRIAVIGLDAHGTQTILSMRQSGFSNFVLCDPFPADKEYFATFPFLRPYIGKEGSKQECLKNYLDAQSPDAVVSIGPEKLTKETLEPFIADCQLCIVCMDKGFSAVFYWVNQIAVSHGVPVLYSAIRGHICYAGPLVIPDKTACYMCYKMRQVATVDNFDEAMSYEEHLNGQKKPAIGERNILPAAIQLLSAVLSSEASKFALNLGPLSLTDKVLEFNVLTFQNTTHSILQKPDCPVCQKKKTPGQQLPADELVRQHGPSRLNELLDIITSPHTGVLKSLELMTKDITEPKLPYIYVAKLANHSFLPKEKHDMMKCSGKGMDIKSARISAAGEAVERYSGTMYPPEDIVYRSFDELDGTALDPRRLVLYLPHQYGDIPYLPFNASQTMGWIPAWSLVRDQPIYVPAHGTIMNYNMQHREELISQTTSNGLATGGSLLSAILSASLEVIERDAFVITWHNKLPARRIRIDGHPDAAIREFIQAYERRSVELQLYQLPTDAPVSVFMCVSVLKKGDGPKVVVGLGCDFSAEKAARQAILEVGQVRPACKQRLRFPEIQKRLAELIANPQLVEELEDHDLLYSSADHLHAFDFLFHQPMTEFDWEAGETGGQENGNMAERCIAEENLQRLIRYCRESGSDLIYSNLTPPDMEKLGLYTARAIIPDFQPIHFGWKHIRMGGDRLYELPKKLGFRATRVPIDELNTFPHPLA
jgi:ribosomal protein S12 methylthiotransferase accessory factor